MTDYFVILKADSVLTDRDRLWQAYFASRINLWTNIFVQFTKSNFCIKLNDRKMLDWIRLIMYSTSGFFHFRSMGEQKLRIDVMVDARDQATCPSSVGVLF